MKRIKRVHSIVWVSVSTALLGLVKYKYRSGFEPRCGFRLRKNQCLCQLFNFLRATLKWVNIASSIKWSNTNRRDFKFKTTRDSICYAGLKWCVYTISSWVVCPWISHHKHCLGFVFGMSNVCWLVQTYAICLSAWAWSCAKLIWVWSCWLGVEIVSAVVYSNINNDITGWC